MSRITIEPVLIDEQGNLHAPPVRTTMSTSQCTRERMQKLVEWHQQQARHPIDIAGSDRARASRARFHENAAKCLDYLITTIKDDALAFIDAADELYSSFCEAKNLDKRQRAALDEFAKASNQWAKHPRKCST